ncbi:MAG TPA: alpha/beta hydrolase [Candidatus Deferrimicrobium sp.]|nr:alpha/beta hydrolase [Candidatus Deferrimicrobium sp.]
MLICKESQLSSRDGMELLYRTWEPEGKQIRAVICLVHGLGEHCARYGHVAETFTREGFALSAFDHRGHGKSNGKRGDASSYQDFMEDIEVALDRITKVYPGLPVFLYGHSLGGNLVLNYVLRHRPSLAGVVVTGPWLKLGSEPPKYLLKLAGVMNRIWPSMTISNGLDTKKLTRNSEVCNSYTADPLVHSKISVRMFFALRQAGEWALENAAIFSLPLLLMHGENDPITSPKASQEFAGKVKEDCTFKLWPGAYHEVHNETNWEEVVQYMVAWIKKTIERNAVPS